MVVAGLGRLVLFVCLVVGWFLVCVLVVVCFFSPPSCAQSRSLLDAQMSASWMESLFE